MTYKISGYTTDNATVYLLQNGNYIGKKDVSVGNYELISSTTSGNGMIAVAANNDGMITGYGEITAISGSESSNIITPSVGAVIKSMQIIPPTKMPDGNFDPEKLVKNYTINAVDPTKTILLNVGFNDSVTTGLPSRTCIRAQLINSTTVRLTRQAVTDPLNVYYYFTVIEYESGIKSIQRGISTPTTLTINSVNTNKTIVNILGMSSTSTTSSHFGGNLIASARGYLSSATQLVLSGNGTCTLSYEVVEFE